MEGRFNGGFFALPVWGAYTWRGLFSEFYGMSKTRKKDVNLELDHDHERKGWTIQLVTSERGTNKLCPEGS